MNRKLTIGLTVVGCLLILITALRGYLYFSQQTGSASNDASASASQTSTNPKMDAYSKFLVTWKYEAPVAEHPLGFTRGDFGQDYAYLTGLGACTGLDAGQKPDKLAERIAATTKFQLAGAQAAVAAAMRNLCPEHNSGYLTAFDQRVLAAQKAIAVHTEDKPSEITTGEAAKAVCGYLESSDPAGLDAYIKSDGLHLPLPVNYYPGNTNYQTTVVDMVENVCPGLAQLLGPEWHV